ncbi:hypothetical protein AB0P41_23115 [Streptomyces sp. NPDC079167]|uniref:hypothetical protein n=1 Tax=Streptomyces sp. NPDC079167 TaxID=3154513 RepID=UPI0034315604
MVSASDAPPQGATQSARQATEVSLDWALTMPFIAMAVLGAWDSKRLSAKVSRLPCSGPSAPCCLGSPQ